MFFILKSMFFTSMLSSDVHLSFSNGDQRHNIYIRKYLLKMMTKCITVCNKIHVTMR